MCSRSHSSNFFFSFFLLNSPIANYLLRLNQNELKRIEQIANNNNANRTNANKECQQFGFHSLAEHDKGRQGQGSNRHHKGKNGTQLCPLESKASATGMVPKISAYMGIPTIVSEDRAKRIVAAKYGFNPTFRYPVVD